MRVFICEFVTGGGMAGENLPPSLLREGAMMRDALLRDLGEIPGLALVTTHDARLSAPEGVESVAIGAQDDAWAVWERLAGRADACWVVAPETGGALLRLTTLARNGGAVTVGPDDETIRICSSKRLTAERLAAHGVPTPATVGPLIGASRLVAKPDDGAGCDATRLLDADEAADLAAGEIVEPYIPGVAASLTVLARDGAAELLAANRQHVALEDGRFAFRGVTVAAFDDADGALARLAADVVAALPGLAGVFGIDVVLSEAGPVAIEVNPRLTTAYAGLRAAIGRNPAALVAPFDALALRQARSAPRTVEIAL